MSAAGADRRRPSYAVVWRVGETAACCGKLKLDEDALIFSGASAPQGLRISFCDLASVSIGRCPDERIDGVTSLVVEHRNGERLLTYVFGSLGALRELCDVLARLVPADAE